MTIQLNDKRVHVPTESYMRQLRTELEDRFTGIKYSIIAMGLVPRTAPIEITLSGADLDLVMETADHLHGVLENIPRSEEHTSELHSRPHLVCRLLLEKKKQLTLKLL